MKKHLLVVLSILAIVAFATTAFALHEVKTQEYTPGLVKAGKTMIELGGEMRIRAEVNDNLSDFSDTGTENVDCSSSTDCSDHNSYYDQRVRLNVKATVSPNTFGLIELENGSDSSDTWKWGSGSSADANGVKRGTMSIRQAYISTNLGKVATLKAGHMLLALGNNLFFDHTKFGDDAILLSIPAGDGEVTLITLKFSEGSGTTTWPATAKNNDLDGYVAAYSTPIGSSTISADFTYLRDHDKGTVYDGFRLWNLGARFNGDFSGIKVKVDAEIQRGKAEELVATGEDLKYSGLALMGGVEIPAGPVSVRVNAAYGSGDDIDTDDKYEGYTNYLSNNQYSTYLYGFKTPTADCTGGSSTSQASCGTIAANSGLTNTWYLNAGVTAKPTTDLKLSGDLYYLRAVKNVSDADDMDSKAIGVELDAKAEYQLDTNLVYFVEAGYLWAGDLYANKTGDKSEIDNPFSVRQGLLLKF